MKRITTRKVSLTLLAIFCLFSVGLYHQPAEARGGYVWFHHYFKSKRVTGTVVLNGCRVSPRRLELLAVPMAVVTDGTELRGNRHLKRRTKERHARLWRTRDPNVFRFSISRLQRNQSYQLSIGAPPNPCGKVFWRGPFDAIVSAGTRNVRIEGFAAKTELEVFDRVADEWVGATTFSLADVAGGSASKNLRWRSSVGGAESGELQIATSAFPKEGAFGTCDEPDSGIVMRTQIPLDANGWTELGSFNFASLFGQTFPPPDGETFPAPNGEFAALARAASNAVNDSSGTDNSLSPISDHARKLISMGAPLYLRVVAKKADGDAACDLRADGVTGWAMVSSDLGLRQLEVPPTPPPPTPLQAGSGHFYGPVFIAMHANGSLLPNYRERAYAVTKPHQLPPGFCNGPVFGIFRQLDPLGCELLDYGRSSGDPMLQPGVTIEPTYRFVLGPQSTGGGGGFNPLAAFTNSLGNLVTGAYTVVSYAVDSAAKLFEDIKNSVAKLALAVLSVEPLAGACDIVQQSTQTDCDMLVKTGIEVGLASMGMPPSLPNFEQLKEQGIAYAAAQVASQFNIPSEFAEEALATLTEESLIIARDAIEDMVRSRGGSDSKYNWVTPFSGLDPAYVELGVRKNTADPVPDGLILLRKTTDLFEGGAHAIPSVFPTSGEQRIPMLLRPNAIGIANPVCRIDPFRTTCTPSFLATKPICLFGAVNFNGQVEYTEYDCNFTGATAPQIYFRDEWYRQRYQPAFCTTISTVSRWDSGLGPVPPPSGYDFWLQAGLGAKQQRRWDGGFYFECFNP